MEVFVKNFATFRTIKKAALIDGFWVIDSLDSEVSSVSVMGTEINSEDVGNWLIVKDLVYSISEVHPSGNSTNLTLKHPLDVFSRPVLFSKQASTQTLGGFASSILLSNWRDCDDSVYAIPYLRVSNLDTTAFVEPELNDGGCFSLPEYCRLMRKSYRLKLRFLNAGDFLLCEISNDPDVAHNVSFSDGRSTLDSATYGAAGYAKLSVLHDINTKEKDTDGNDIYIRETSTWYLLEDGSVSQLASGRRVSGKWGVLHLKDCPNIAEKVIEEFSKNKTGHKVEFRSALDLPVNSNCKFAINGKIIQSHISYKRKDSKNVWFYYKAGELATTITEKLKGVL